MSIIFLDTGFHFPETLSFRDELQKRYGLKIKVVRPTVESSQLLAQYGEGLYRRDPDLCCYIHKVEPMQRVTSTLRALVAGIRRDQTAHRRQLRVIEAGPARALRVHPMIHWSQHDISKYIDKHNLPSHPLFSKGYLSVGCAPCTRPVYEGEDERAGRWADKEKNECGLHVELESNREETR